jgi:archaellum component FlaF (FlaF/FlaG flagellin family)
MVPVSVIELIIGVAVILATAFSLWVNLNNEYTKLKSRVYQLEQSDIDLKATLVEISARLHAIELLLASNQIKEK